MGAFLDNPDFAKVAEAFGIRGVSVSTEDELKTAVEEAHAFDGPIVLDVHVDRVENVYPMIVPGTGVRTVIQDPR